MSEQARTVAERVSGQIDTDQHGACWLPEEHEAVVTRIADALDAYAAEIRQEQAADVARLREALMDARNALVYQGKHWPIDMTTEFAAIDAALKEYPECPDPAKP